MSHKQKSIAFFLGYAILLIGLVIYLFNIYNGFYVFGVGVLINTVFRFQILPKTTNKRVRRLNNQHFIIVAGFILSAYLMYKSHSAWVLPVFISGVIELFLTFRYPKNK